MSPSRSTNEWRGGEASPVSAFFPHDVASALRDAPSTLALLQRWVERQWLRPLDEAFASFLLREVPETPPLLLLAAALASHQLGRGHVCLDLEATLLDPSLALSLPPEGDERQKTDEEFATPTDLLRGVTLPEWLATIVHADLTGDGPGDTPLVRVGSRLYLRRYWQYEQDVRAGIDDRLARSEEHPSAARVSAPPPAGGQFDVGRAQAPEGCLHPPQPSTTGTADQSEICTLNGADESRPRETPGHAAGAPTASSLRPILDTLFPPSDPTKADWQKIACALAARSAFSIVTGGPGTGKTTTVVRLLALLQALAIGPDGDGTRALRIRLAAPTGKAASRLVGSITNAIGSLPLEHLPAGETIRAAIPSHVTTLHRLLGSRPDTRHFRHDADTPLAVDVLVVDEASMIDLEMMAAVLAALPASARMVLIGDKDQLASVEAGAVLGQLCARASEGHYLPSTCDWILEATGERIDTGLMDPAGKPQDQSVTMLRHSRRFDARSGIGMLAEAVNTGNVHAVGEILGRGSNDLALLTQPDEARLTALILDGGAIMASASPAQTRYGYRHYLETMQHSRPAADADDAAFDAWAASVLKAHGSFQVLCALRRGAWGVEGLNSRIAAVLRAEGLIPAADGWYVGRPILVNRNDYGLGLMNGDIGITLGRPDETGRAWVPRVAFASAESPGGIRWVLPSRLRDVDTVYALTVHKSQGSEFSHAALVLPDTPSPIATRELLYTGITRASRWLTLVRPGDPSTLDRAATRRVIRTSGLT